MLVFTSQKRRGMNKYNIAYKTGLVDNRMARDVGKQLWDVAKKYHRGAFTNMEWL